MLSGMLYPLLQIVIIIQGLCGAPKHVRGKQKAPRTESIIGGFASTDSKWPWQLAISVMETGSTEFKLRCGGTLVTPRLVLTAAHCVKNPAVTVNQLKIVAGEYDRSKVDGTEQTFQVTDMVTHENYTGSLSDLFKNDIAILKLDRGVTVNKYVKPVPGLADQSTSIDSTYTCFMTGWGVAIRVKGKATEPMMAGTLQEAEVHVLTNAVCNKPRHWSTLIQPDQLCAYNRRISACLGDSGGPLMCRTTNETFIQVGITSWGSKACNGKPSVFTRLANYRQWIDEKIDIFKTLGQDPTTP